MCPVRLTEWAQNGVLFIYLFIYLFKISKRQEGGEGSLPFFLFSLPLLSCLVLGGKERKGGRLEELTDAF